MRARSTLFTFLSLFSNSPSASHSESRAASPRRSDVRWTPFQKMVQKNPANLPINDAGAWRHPETELLAHRGDEDVDFVSKFLGLFVGYLEVGVPAWR